MSIRSDFSQLSEGDLVTLIGTFEVWSDGPDDDGAIGIVDSDGVGVKLLPSVGFQISAVVPALKRGDEVKFLNNNNPVSGTVLATHEGLAWVLHPNYTSPLTEKIADLVRVKP